MMMNQTRLRRRGMGELGWGPALPIPNPSPIPWMSIGVYQDYINPNRPELQPGSANYGMASGNSFFSQYGTYLLLGGGLLLVVALLSSGQSRR